MGFIDAIKVCFEKYVDFNGRASRSEFWWFYLATFILSMIAGAISSWLSSIVSLAVLLPSIAAGVRRMHDVGKSGWYLIIPIYNIILAASPSEQAENQWGPIPE